MLAITFILLGTLIACCKSEVVFNAIALDDILSEDYMPTTLLMLENPKIIRKYENSTADSKIDKTILGLDGSLGKAMETMDFHRSMMNQYMCRSFVAEQIVANMSTSRVKRRMGHVTSGVGESSSPQTDISKNLIYDEGSSGYQDWLSKSATLEDIYRHYDNPQDRIDVVEDVDDGNPEDFEEGYNVEDINKQETKAALNHRHEETYYSAAGYPGPSYSNSYGPPNYSPSSYGQQSYNPPNYNQPTYSQPSYNQPTYGGSPDYHQNTGGGGGYQQHQPESHGSYEPHFPEPEYHNSPPAPKYHVYNYYSKDKDLSDLFEIALTGLAFLAFKMFIVHVIMCIASTTTTNTTTTTVAMAMSMSPTATATGNGMADIPGTGGGTSTGGGMTSTGGGMPSTGADMPGTGGGMTSTGGGMTSTGGGMTGDGGDTPGTGGGMTSDGGDMPGTGSGMTSDGGDMPGTGGGMTSDGSDMPGTGDGMTGGDMPGTGDGMTDDGMTDMGGGMTGGGTGTGDGGDGSTDTGSTGSGTTGTGDGMDAGMGGDSTGTGGTDGGTGMGTTGSDSTGTGGSSAMGTGMDETAADGTATGDGSEALQFRYKRNPMPQFPNPKNEIINELSRKILLTIESSLVAHKDDGVCLRKILCENNKWSRDLEGRHKLFIPLWSLGMSWLSGKIVHNVAPATSMLDTLKASILGLGKANCEIIYQKCDLRNHVMERKRRKRRKREAL
ncbi:uncharacterized protein LOC126888653 [Diabrotica virgifera virgifera]|uniref:Uncharacterized protein n=1 Tax=Diabrotica virgifera virgifera TaxID=50390 RepID=A0ABM5KS05_DIAVI|nr:uncharacterized protein LOC126888653 [Diabrotica virgifera virgifera]